MNDRIILEAKHVRKVFRTGPQVLEVLKDVNLRIEKGQIAGIFGPSGSGKSTLLHILG
ncbi:MAG TPA: ATP-binding cassette domain-containing protein, partial [candidate division WOR-3 bacterium]|nr:ATP-binding cassette domain-containing protein [candidate division WOR-3 bacterium]